MEIETIRKSLESIKLTTEKGGFYWTGRDLQPILGYSSWEKFEGVIKRAIKACESVGIEPDGQFHRTVKVMKKSDGTETTMADYAFSRYAAYLVCVNGSTPEAGVAQNYFVIKTRQKEIEDAHTEQEKRLLLRQRVKNANRNLNEAAKVAGVQNYGLFHDAGYRGLYEMGYADIKRVKGLDPKEDLLDRAGRTELAANEFRITQAEDKIRREEIKGEKPAINAHHYVGQEVRKTIEKLGGTKPEKLPMENSIKKLVQQKKKETKSLLQE